MRTLLIGNGINYNSENKDDFSNVKLYKRFLDIFKKILPLWNNIFVISKNEIDNIENIIINYKDGIESLADDILKYFEQSNKIKTSNDRYDFISFITLIGLNAIFFKDSEINFPKINCSIINKLKTYDKIFTLNYHEEWDKHQKCIYLHGKFENNNFFENDKNILLYDNFLYDHFINDKMFQSNFEKLSYKNNLLPVFNVNKIIFAPKSIKKQNINSIYPDNNLFPSNRLFPSFSLPLYDELKSCHELDVFGVSPYGDTDIINIIKKVKKVNIYIYNNYELNVSNKEFCDWKREIPNASFINSLEFLK